MERWQTDQGNLKSSQFQERSEEREGFTTHASPTSQFYLPRGSSGYKDFMTPSLLILPSEWWLRFHRSWDTSKLHIAHCVHPLDCQSLKDRVSH